MGKKPLYFYSSLGNKESYKQIRDIFEEITNHKKEFAKRFYKFLLEGLDKLPANI